MELAIRVGLETLVRTIFEYSENSTTVPAVILLEQFPHDYVVFDSSRGSQGGSYTTLYRRIAKHYGILLWSYRSYVWAPLTSPPPALIRMLAVHPPWHGHLHIANLLAASILEMLDTCPSARKIEWSAAILPERLFQTSSFASEFCDSREPYILDMNPMPFVIPSNVSEFEERLSGWMAYVDYHEEPGWIINNSTLISGRELTFRFKLPPNTDADQFALRIKYLQTYENAGGFAIFVCRQYLAAIDTLSVHYQTHRVSTSEFALFKFLRFAPKCRSHPNEVVLRYKVPKQYNPERGQEKVKILSLQICRPAPMI